MSSIDDTIREALRDARQISASLGLRPYRVLSVRRHWTGGEPGRGAACELKCEELSPRPRVEFRHRRELTAHGHVDRSTVVLSEIDTALTEAEVLAFFSPKLLERGDEAYVEIVADERGGVLRRYVLAEPPERRALEWRVTLRERSGGPR